MFRVYNKPQTTYNMPFLKTDVRLLFALLYVSPQHAVSFCILVWGVLNAGCCYTWNDSMNFQCNFKWKWQKKDPQTTTKWNICCGGLSCHTTIPGRFSFLFFPTHNFPSAPPLCLYYARRCTNLKVISMYFLFLWACNSTNNTRRVSERERESKKKLEPNRQIKNAERERNKKNKMKWAHHFHFHFQQTNKWI